MLARCFRFKTASPLGLAALMALGLVLLPTVAGTAPQQTYRALDCNSDLDIGLPPMGIAPGATVPVTLMVTSGPSTDAANANVAQQFDTINFFPSCDNTLPCVPPAAPLPITFVGFVSNTCGVMPTATAMAGGSQIEFSFPPNPPALTLPAAPAGDATISCELVFDVLIDAGFTGTIDMEATTSGVCDPGGLMLNSSAEATATVTVVPTLGEYGLIALALLLVAASWFHLRRRAVTG